MLSARKVFSNAMVLALIVLPCHALSHPPQQGDDAVGLTQTLVRLAIEDHDGTAISKVDQIYFLRVSDRDPSDELLSKFTAEGSTIKKASSCRRVHERGLPWGLYEYVDKVTKKRGVLITVQIERWERQDSVVAHFGWDDSGMSGRAITARLERINGDWKITEKLWEMQS